MGDEASDEKPVTFHIKTAGDAKYTVTVPLSMAVSGLKELLATEQYANLPVDRQRLIYSGRVLKDADPLSGYKIKEGNTVHMVKTAESNTRNQPSAAPSGNAASSSASGSAPQLPSMAAGTGANNLLAGLTGARFAGLAQLPNQSMFGPDGGMGAPPDPEEALRHLEDPEARRQLNEALSNPAVIDEMIRQNPMLAGMPGAREMLQSPAFRDMITNPDIIRSMRMQRNMAGGPFGGGNAGPGFQAPGGVDAGEGGASTEGAAPGAQAGQGGQIPSNNPFAAMFGAGGGAGAGNPFAALFNPAAAPGGAQGQGQTGEGGAAEGGPAGAGMGANPFGTPFNNPFAQNMMRNMMADPELMQRLTQSMFGSPAQGATGQGAGSGDTRAGGGDAASGSAQGSNAAQNPMNPFAALFGGGMPGGNAGNPFAAFGNLPTSPPDDRPPEVRYEEQLRQLNDMGFYDFDRNVEALRRSGGSVQGAVNFLLGG